MKNTRSGQIITTSAEVTLNGGLIRELPQNPLNSGLGIILIYPDKIFFCNFLDVQEGWFFIKALDNLRMNLEIRFLTIFVLMNLFVVRG